MKVLFLSGACDDVCFLDPGMSERVAFLPKAAKPSSVLTMVGEMLAPNHNHARVRIRAFDAPIRRRAPAEPRHPLVRVARRIARNRARTRLLTRKLLCDFDSFRMLRTRSAHLVRELAASVLPAQIKKRP